ncbi:hypothetical protein ABZX85_35905 [Streptomyces sp. NPDC004539]|uniref:hypothetical protein n=1 Tax=Streptomyces sp. NPDC004539 TaxID=3154280 RepID=UPI0033B158FD
MTADHPAPAAGHEIRAAQAALAAARSARAAALAARRVPTWHPPAAGLLHAAGFTGLALAMNQDHANAHLMAASLTCLLAFLALFVVDARAGGVLLPPTGTPRERWRRQSPALLTTAAAVATAFLTDPSAGLAVYGVTQGAVTWFQMRRSGARPTA